MDRTRATLEVNKRAPSFGNQKMSIVGETQSTRLLQARHQRNKTMELSDKACPRLSAVPDLFEYVQCCDDETKMGLVKDVNKSHMMERALLRDLFRSMLTLQSMQLGVYAMGSHFFSIKYSTNMILMLQSADPFLARMSCPRWNTPVKDSDPCGCREPRNSYCARIVVRR